MENSKTTTENQEISYLSLFENAKKSLQLEDNKNANYYLNLVINSEEIKNDLNTKYLCLIFVNQINFKQKNQTVCLNNAKKVMKYILTKKYKLLSNDIQILFLSVLYSAAKLLDENDNNLLASLLLYNGKSFIDDLNLDPEDRNYQFVMKGFSSNMSKLNEYIEIKRNEIELKKDTFKELLNMTSNIDQKFRNKSPSKSYFLVSTLWYNKMVLFLKAYLEKTKDLDNMFYSNNIALLYIDKEDDDPEDREEFLGCYPGPINNFFLIKGCNIWIDPLDNSSNKFLYKNIVEGKNYKLFPIEIYEKIKEIFGVYEEIERKAIEIDNEIEVEIHYRKLKVLFINEYLRDSMKEAITIKNIQVPKFMKLEELKKKLIRCFKNINKNKVNENEDDEKCLYDLKLFKLQKQKSQEIFNVIISHVNKNKIYKLNAEEIKFNNENANKHLDNINIFDKKDDTSNYLIVEVIPKNMIVKPFIRIQTDVYNCIQCQVKILSRDMIVFCDLCTQSTYCSDYCKDIDEQHKEFHKKISGIYKKKFFLGSLKDIKIESFFDPYSKAGMIGFKNYGNTCFISTTIHLLANCLELSKYFLSKIHLEEINKGSKKNSKGFVTKLFYDLLKDYWLSAQECIQPIELKQMVTNLTNQIQGMNLNDTHDMIILLLRALHEDLNRVTDSSDLSLDFSEKYEKESDCEAADRWWNNFLKRENSIITDLFYGQLKISMKCPDCKNSQLTYEPFLTLSLPIGEKSDSRARFKIFLNDFKYEFFQIEIIEVDKFTSVKTLIEKVKEHSFCKKKEFDVLLLKDKEITKVLPDEELIYDYVFQRIDFTQEVFIDWELIVTEVEQNAVEKNKGENVTFYVCPYNLIKENYLYYFTSEAKSFLCYPKAISISKKSKLKDLYIEVFRYFRRIMENIEKKTFKNFYENILDYVYVEKEFDCYFKEPKDAIDKVLKESNELKELKENEDETSDKINNTINDNEEKETEENDKKKYREPFNLYLSNNIPISQSYFTSTPKCEFCDTHCINCKIQNDENVTIHEFFARQKIQREFIVHADFSLFNSNFRRFYFENTDIDDPLINCRGDISIYECLSQFQKESKIEKPKEDDMDKIKENDKENYFYCKYCRRNLKGLKKMEIWRSPNILIIQFKRFKMKVASLMELVQNRKNETHVDFQIYLDLKKFVLGADKESAEYELISVCNHSGKMNAGKNTAVKKGIKDGNWYEFIDESYIEISEDDLSSTNAYLLVFKKIEKSEEDKLKEEKEKESDGKKDNESNKFAEMGINKKE